MAEREIKYRIVGDASSGVEASKQAAGGLEQFSQGTQEAGKQTEKFNFHGKEAHKVMHMLNEIAPGLGSLLKATMNPEAIGMIALLLALQQVVKLVEQWRQKQEDLKKEQFDMARSAEDAFRKSAEAAENYLDKIKDIESKSSNVKALEDFRLQVLKAQNEVSEKLVKNEADRAYLAEQHAQSELKLKDVMLAESKARAEELKGEMVDAQSGADSGFVSATQAEARRQNRKDKIDAAVKKRQELEKSALPRITMGSEEVPTEETIKTAREIRAKELADAQKEIDDLRKQDIADLRIIRAQSRAEKRADRSIDAYQKAQEDVRTREAESNAASSVFDIRARGRVKVGLQEAGFPDNAVNERVFRAVEAERAIGRGERIDAGQTGDISFLANALHTATGANIQQIRAFLKALQDQQSDLADLVREALSQINTRSLNHGSG